MTLTNLLKTFNEEKVVVKEDDKYVEKDLEGVSLKGVLQRGRIKLTKERHSQLQTVSFSPSTITYSYCRRAKIGQMAGAISLYYDKPAPRLQLTFDLGHAIHDVVQGYFWDLGMLKGSYQCLKCDKIYHDLVAPTSCPSGKKTHERKHMRYKEVKATNEEYMINGRCDGILVIDGEEHIVDVKSISNRTPKNSDKQWCFEDLAHRGPKPDHVVQLTLYMWMLGIERGHLLYVAKNEPQIRSFAIPYDHSIIAPFLEEIASLISVANSLRKGEKVSLPSPCGDEKCPCSSVLSTMTIQEVKT